VPRVVRVFFAPKWRAWRYPKGERGMPGARCTRSRACRIGSTRVSHHGRTGITRHSRTRWCYSLFRALLGDRALLSPSPVKSACRARQGRHRSFTNLTPASGRQDHTTSPSASWHARQSRHPRPSHPDPTFVTIAKRPFVLGRDGGGYRSDLGRK
jgi:hypothetical protein